MGEGSDTRRSVPPISPPSLLPSFCPPPSTTRPPPPPPQVRAHDDMVTSLDALMDTALISVGLDATLCYWDLRVLSTTQLAPAVARMQVGGRSGGTGG